jgi:nondiscriminating aspartyl-tRNA synthetase
MQLKGERINISHSCDEITPALEGREVVLAGFVKSVRDLGGIRFFLLYDIRGEVQVTAPKSLTPPEVFAQLSSLTPESAVLVKGTVKAAEQAPRGVEILPKMVEVLSRAAVPLPLDPTGRIKSTLETRLNARILDLRHVQRRTIFRARHIVLDSIRQFLSSRGFLEVHTPKIVATATESGSALFPVAYFEREAFLSQSPQLYKEILTGCFQEVFEIGPIFRAEEFNTPKHLNEVTSVDIEMAFADYEDVMKVLEELIENVVRSLKEKMGRELPLLEQLSQRPPFERLTYREALEILEKKGCKIPWGSDLPTPAERILGEGRGFYFITHWPAECKPFYAMPCQHDPSCTETFDLMWKDLELASGGTRIHQPEMLEERLKAKGLNPESFEPHLRNFRWGLIPPHAGWGLGLERLLMVLTGQENIRECVLFPRDRHRLVP